MAEILAPILSGTMFLFLVGICIVVIFTVLQCIWGVLKWLFAWLPLPKGEHGRHDNRTPVKDKDKGSADVVEVKDTSVEWEMADSRSGEVRTFVWRGGRD